MRKHAFLILLWAAHCEGNSNGGGGPTSWTLMPQTTLEGFAVYAGEIRATERGLLGSFTVRASAGEEARQHVRLVGVDGKAAYDHAYRADTVSGRLSEVEDGSVFVSEAAEVIDEFFSKVRIRRMALADGALQDDEMMPEPMLNLPLAEAIHRGTDGRLWCLGVNSDLALMLYGLGKNAPVTKIPIAARTSVDLRSRIVGLRDGFAVVTSSADVEARFGVPASRKGAEQVAVLSFDASGNFVEAQTTGFDARAALGAVRVDGTRIAITGSVEHTLNDNSLFVRSWTLAQGARLVREAESTFDLGTEQVRISALDVAPDGRWIAGGEVGTRQAETGSILQGSRAFMATLSAAPAFTLQGYATFGTPERRNAIAAFARAPDGGGQEYAFVHHDFPKTHDADGRPDQAYSRTELYQLQVWSQ
ncbi:hypothetical protein LZC95_11575 [Pendulispora brunnea]|uniref:Uncharacterized protein n=1 Tax=Pendulispora brunnea TaxID=2905690 RepID=A0ABZ2KFM9_9BACT